MPHFTHEGLTFDAHESGPSQRPIVVLLHGFPQDSTAWDNVIPRLHQAGLRTLTFDQRGYTSGNTAVAARDYGIPALAGDVLAALDAAGAERAHVVGHDWGGAVAWHLAGTSSRVDSLTVLSTPHPGALMWSFTHSRQALMSYYMALFQLPRAPERYLSPRLYGFYRKTGLPRKQAQRYAERFAHPATLTGPMNWYRAALRNRSATPTSKVPTTYVWGRNDFALGEAAAHRTARYVPASYRFVELEAGHWLPETHPDVVAAEIVGQVRRAH